MGRVRGQEVRELLAGHHQKCAPVGAQAPLGILAPTRPTPVSQASGVLMIYDPNVRTQERDIELWHKAFIQPLKLADTQVGTSCREGRDRRCGGGEDSRGILLVQRGLASARRLGLPSPPLPSCSPSPPGIGVRTPARPGGQAQLAASAGAGEARLRGLSAGQRRRNRGAPKGV